MKLRVETKIDYDNKKIFQELIQNVEGTGLKPPEIKLNGWIVDTREQKTKEALICLGWTPPPDEANISGTAIDHNYHEQLKKAASYTGAERLLSPLGAFFQQRKQIAEWLLTGIVDKDMKNMFFYLNNEIKKILAL